MSAPLSDLGRARDETGEVVAVERLTGGMVEVTVRLPHLASTARPGEFAQLRAWDGVEPLLRRPFSVAWTEGESCAFVLEAVGVGTRLLVALRPGDRLHALGPLGNGFGLDPPPARALIVSGGLGCAPFPLLVRELRRGGCGEVIVLSGAATADRLYPAERFRRGDDAVRVVEVTDDGSRGRRGLVTELVAEHCDDDGGRLRLRSQSDAGGAGGDRATRLPRPPRRAEVSLEAPMGCGFGTCLGCALPRGRGGMGSLLPPGTGDGGLAGGLARAARPAPGARRVSAPDLRVDLGRGLVLPNPVDWRAAPPATASSSAGSSTSNASAPSSPRGRPSTLGTATRRPRVAEVRGGMLNSIGLHNPGVDHVAVVYGPEFARWKIPVVINVAGGDVDDYLRCLDRLDAADGVAGYELNISCPNIANGLDFGRDPAAAARLVAAARARTARHLMVKLSPNVTDIAAVARAVEEAGADSVSAINTYVGMKIHRGIRAPVLPGRGTGGLSGPVLKPLALAAVAQVRAAVSIPVVGVGGIMDAGDALEFLIAGAVAVQVGTATFVNPAAALDILDGLVALAERDGTAWIGGRRGGDRSAVPPAGIEPASTG